jgi:hypothetical protein
MGVAFGNVIWGIPVAADGEFAGSVHHDRHGWAFVSSAAAVIGPEPHRLQRGFVAGHSVDPAGHRAHRRFLRAGLHDRHLLGLPRKVRLDSMSY